jgi:hypothetical protein
MTTLDLRKLTSALDGIEAVLARAPGGLADDEALLEFRRFCWSALLLLGEAECQDEIDLLVRCAKELYSDCEPHRVDILRANVRIALGMLRQAPARSKRAA